jgi:FkbM family methyltransferase
MKNIKKAIKNILPKKILEIILAFKNYYIEKYYYKSYSQEGEDMILRSLMRNQELGFYVDIGAHHPKRFSNTYFFYKLGWRGINVDAMPGSMKLFNKIRPRDINIEKPLSDKKETLTYYSFNEPAVNTLSKEAAIETTRNSGYSLMFKKNIETSTLEEILEEYLSDNQEIDFMSIDVEGMDFKVLKSNNWNKFKPKVVAIEILWCLLSNVENDEITGYMKNCGYLPFSKTVNTVIFIENNFYEKNLRRDSAYL